MAATGMIIEEFPRILEENSTKAKTSSLEDILGKIKAVNCANPPVYDDQRIQEFLKERAKVLRTLVDEYFVMAVSHEFPLLSEDLFNLKRYIGLGKEGKQYKVISDNTNPKESSKKKDTEVKRAEIPLFAYTKLLEGNHVVEMGKITRTRTVYDGNYGGHYKRKTTVKIEAKLPGIIGQNLREAAGYALSHYYTTLGKAFSTPVIRELMLEDKLPNPELGAVWIPTPDSLKLEVKTQVIERRPPVLPRSIDPAMILTARGKRYLVKTWKVDNEEPFEHYLREFTSGDLRKKL